jgi:hypothetical protein
MAHKKGDKVLVISGDDESGYIVTVDEVVTGGNKINLKKTPGEFNSNGKSNNKRIVPLPDSLSPDLSKSVFVRSGKVINNVGLSYGDILKIMEEKP